MRPSGPSSTARLYAGRRLAGLSPMAWLYVVGILIATVLPAQAEEAEPTLSAALQRIYSAGVPASVEDLRQMDAHQRAASRNSRRSPSGSRSGRRREAA